MAKEKKNKKVTLGRPYQAPIGAPYYFKVEIGSGENATSPPKAHGEIIS